MILGFCAYLAVRSAVADEARTAYFNALAIIELERDLAIWAERGLNAWAERSHFWTQAASLAYFWLLFPLIIAVGLWLYASQRRKYIVMRDAFLASGALGLVFFGLFPAAPPRMLADLAGQFDPTPPPEVFGFVDSVKVHLRYAHDSASTGLWVNSYAAMPCLHAGWNLLLGIAIAWAFWGTRWQWPATIAGGVLPVVQSLAVVLTANHYFLDIVAGLLVSALGIPIAIGLQRSLYPFAGRWAPRLAAGWRKAGDPVGSEAG